MRWKRSLWVMGGRGWELVDGTSIPVVLVADHPQQRMSANAATLLHVVSVR